MPTLTRWFLKAALVYLILALSIGILLVLPNRSTIRDIPGLSAPAYIRMVDPVDLRRRVMDVSKIYAHETTRIRMAGMGNIHYAQYRFTTARDLRAT